MHSNVLLKLQSCLPKILQKLLKNEKLLRKRLEIVQKNNEKIVGKIVRIFNLKKCRKYILDEA